MTVKCSTCGFYEPTPAAPGEMTKSGLCFWEPPPFVGRLVAMAQAEAAMRINWAAESDKPPVVLPGHKCSAWQAKGSPATKAERLIVPAMQAPKASQ